MREKKSTVRPSPSRQEIIQNELLWHEEEAHRRIPIDQFLYAPPAFDAVVDEGIAFLAVNPEEWLLEIGCGEGKESVKFHARQWKVVSIDLSHVQLQRARDAMRENFGDANAFFVQANAEELPFAEDSFHAIYAKAVLHHLDMGIAFAEIDRTLNRGGRIAIAEPLANHPMIRLGRLLTPALRTRDERPIPYREFRQFAARFSDVRVSTYFLTAPLAYVFRMFPSGEKWFRRTHRLLQRVDTWLFRAFPLLQRLAWYSSLRARI